MTKPMLIVPVWKIHPEMGAATLLSGQGSFHNCVRQMKHSLQVPILNKLMIEGKVSLLESDLQKSFL